MVVAATALSHTLFFLVIFFLFLEITATFFRLTITITPSSVSIGYGILTYTVLWENIKGCYHVNETLASIYGGSGIYPIEVRGKSRLVYGVYGRPQVVLSLKKGRFKEIAFSTENPEEILMIVKEWAAIR
jgi:hypothetical protein